MNIRRRTEEDTITATEPSFASLALAGQPPPDWADVVIVPLPQGAHGGPRCWAERVFDGSDLPKPVLTLMGLRQFLVRLVGIGPAPSTVFDVAAVVGDEALIVELEDHLDFRCGVGVDHEAGLLRVTTAVWLHGWRGRLYFAPVSVLHDPITRAMMRRAVRRAGGST